MRFFLPLVVLGSSAALVSSVVLAGCSGTDASINDNGDDDDGSTGDGGASHADGGGSDATTGDDGGSGQDATTGDGSPGGTDGGLEAGAEAGGGDEGGTLDAGDAGDAADAGPSPDNVPITVTYLGDDDDDIGFQVSVDIGGTTVPALLDTGSSGLRIVQGAVPMDAFTGISTTPVSTTYSSGTVVTGVVAAATITLGSLSTAAAIPVELITAVGCTEAKPDCPAHGESLDDFSFKGESGGTWKVIVGVGMRTPGDGSNIGNPIVQLPGMPAYVVDLSGGYGTTTGTLRIGPTTAEKTTFKTNTMGPFAGGGTLGNGVGAYDDRQNPVCVDDTSATLTYCAAALLDCGNAPMVIDWAQENNTHDIPSGDMVDVALQTDLTAEGTVLGSYDFTVGKDAKPGLDLVIIAKTADANSSMNTGTAFFFRQKVLEDQTNGSIGVAPF